MMPLDVKFANPLELSRAQGRRVVVEGLPPGGLAYLCATASCAAPLLCLCADEERAERLHQDLVALGVGEAILFLGQEHVPFADVASDTAVGFARAALRQRLLRGAKPPLIVSSVAAVQTLWPHPDDILGCSQTFAVGTEVERGALAMHLVRCGFLPVSFVEDEGTFALRGGVIDIFVPGLPRPMRLDFFGDEIV
ncbi:MAG: hypothetical protein EOO40_11730, partial [Deltaproteobacteria bacterium]